MFSFLSIFPNNIDEPFLKGLPKLDWPKQSGSVQIGEGTEIGDHVVLEDNVIIGKNCLIRPHAYIRSGTVIEDNVVIGHGSEVKHAYIFSGAKIGSLCFVGDSIIGKGARIGSGTITGNRRFDQEIIDWVTNEGKISSGLDKLGLLLGDNARLGANVTTNPGTVIGPYTWVSGGEVISGFLPEQSFMKPGGEVIKNTKAKELRSTDQEGVR